MAATLIPRDVCRYIAEIEFLALKRRKAVEALQIYGKCGDAVIFPQCVPKTLATYNALSSQLLLLRQSNKRKREVSIEKVFCKKSPLVQPLSGFFVTKEPSKADDTVLCESSVSPNKPPPTKKAKHKDVRWLSNFEELKKYKQVHGNCIVPRGYSANPRLASWVAEQRKQRKLLVDGKQSSMIPERVEMLNEIGFVWNAQEAAWERQLGDLKLFRKEEGHCLVPVGHKKYPKLGSWVKEQRRHFVLLKQGKQSNMTISRVEKLDAVNFCWNTHEALWLERFHELSEYKDIHGHSVVPTKCAENQRLGTWVHHQRREYKKYKQGKPSHMTEERIKHLDSLDFVWFPRDSCNNSVRSVSPSDSMLSSSTASSDLFLDEDLGKGRDEVSV